MLTDTSQHFPFSAVVAQPEFKLALLLAAVNPLVGGVLVSGPRGAAKSTLAKGLADVLPKGEQAHPFVTLPLGATEEMLCGTLNLQQVLDEQRVEFQEGLLAKAHGGVLYVDEVNLLADYLVDLLLDVAASGINIVERDGISHQHSAQFILLGTMNPDEGELRSQLLDRFGLSVTLSSQYSVEQRINIVKLRESFDKDPAAFYQQYTQQQQAIANSIVKAKSLIHQVQCSDEHRMLIAKRCCEANVDGLRADIVWLQAALAHAALAGRTEVTIEDLQTVENLVLNHRRQASLPQPPSSPPPFSRPDASRQAPQDSNNGDWGAMEPQTQATQVLEKISFAQADIKKKPNDQADAFSGLMQNKHAGKHKGQYQSHKESRKVHWFQSLVSSAGQWPLRALNFYKQRQSAAHIHLVLLDTSGSILSHQALAKAKGVILQISQQAYLQREQITIIGFGNQQAELLLNVNRAPKEILEQLDAISASGGTPLAEALMRAKKFQQQQSKKNANVQFSNYLITDGRVHNIHTLEQLHGQTVVVDVECSTVKRGKAQSIADVLKAHYIPLMV